MSRSSKNTKMKFNIESEYTLALEEAVKKLLSKEDGWKDDTYSSDYQYDSNTNAAYCKFCGADDAHTENYQKNGMTYTRVVVTHAETCPWENLRKLVEE